MFSRKISQCLHIYDYSCLNLTVQVRKQEILIFYDSDSGGRKKKLLGWRLFQCFSINNSLVTLHTGLQQKEFGLKKKKRKKKEASGEFSSKEQTQKSGLKSKFWTPPITLTYVVSVNVCSISSQFKTKNQKLFFSFKVKLKSDNIFLVYY